MIFLFLNSFRNMAHCVEAKFQVVFLLKYCVINTNYLCSDTEYRNEVCTINKYALHFMTVYIKFL